jgi:large subunit ribosomal protein L28
MDVATKRDYNTPGRVSRGPGPGELNAGQALLYSWFVLGPDAGPAEDLMAQRCDICGKGAQFGSRVSHAHNVTSRRFNPNLQRVRAVTGKGTHRRVRVCTRCLRSGRVQKPTKRTKPAA